MDLFINTSLNHISFISHVVSQSKNKLIPNSEQVILPINPLGKNSKKNQINPETLDENKNSKVCAIKILIDSGASALIVRKEILYEHQNS